jgi:hypothetical protein
LAVHFNFATPVKINASIIDQRLTAAQEEIRQRAADELRITRLDGDVSALNIGALSYNDLRYGPEDD